jgi:hypothetical protein
MGGEGYALERALSDTALAQLRSNEKCARSDFPRRWPSVVYDVWRCGVEDCMEIITQTLVLLSTELQLSLGGVLMPTVWLSVLIHQMSFTLPSVPNV